jgi:hypothetical protein
MNENRDDWWRSAEGREYELASQYASGYFDGQREGRVPIDWIGRWVIHIQDPLARRRAFEVVRKAFGPRSPDEETEPSGTPGEAPPS